MIKYVLSALAISLLIGCGGSNGTPKSHGGNGNGNQNPKKHTTIKEDISKTKEVFSSLRTEALSVVNEDKNATLDKEAKLLTNATKDISFDLNSIGDSISKLIDLITEAQDENLTSASNDHMTVTKNGDVWSYTIDDKYDGNISIPEKFSDFNISNFDKETFKLNGDLPKSKDTDIMINLEKTNDGAKLDIDKITLNSGEDSLTISPLLADISYNYDANEDLTKDEVFKLKKAALKGKFQDFDIDGTLTVPSYVQNSSLKDLKDKNEGYIPSSLMFNGTIKDSKTENEFAGTLNAVWHDAANFDISQEDSKPDATISFDGTLKRKNTAQIKLNLGADIKKDELTLGFESGEHKINTVSHVNEQGDGTIKITTPDGLEATIKLVNGEIDYDNSSDIKVNGRKVGELVDRKGVPVIKYTDGTFESLI